MIDTRFETNIDLRGEIENYRQVALIKYYKILLELDPRRDRLTYSPSFVVSTSSKDIPKSENGHETTRRKCWPKELSLGTIRNAANSSEKPDYTTSSPPSTSSTTKKSSTHTRNGKSVNDSKPAVGKLSEGRPKRTRPKKKNPCNRPPLTKPIRTCK